MSFAVYHIFGFKVLSQQTKISFRGDLSCIYILFELVGVALLETKSDSVAVGSLTDDIFFLLKIDHDQFVC